MRRSIIALSTLLCMTVAMPVASAEPAKPKPVVKVVKKPHKTKVILHPKKIAYRASRSAGYNLKQWRCLELLWTKESHFNPKARNKRSGAYGIAQFMPQTWGNYKVKKTSDPALQIKYGLRYIRSRYGEPCTAWKFHKRHHWY